MTMMKPELLSPAGSMDSLKAAVNSGCDAVYLGGKKFGARAYAGNFDLQELEEVCDYCHLRGVKVYVTVNTVYKDEELKEFLAYIKDLYEMGVDALIMQDAGAAKLVREHFPDFPLHASTQMTCNSLADVKYWESQGFNKIVLSRELSTEEIKYITANVDAEIDKCVTALLNTSSHTMIERINKRSEELEQQKKALNGSIMDNFLTKELFLELV